LKCWNAYLGAVRIGDVGEVRHLTSCDGRPVMARLGCLITRCRLFAQKEKGALEHSMLSCVD